MVLTSTPTLQVQPQTKKSVLVVDDDPAMLRVMDLILRRSGLQVWQAVSGPEALDILRQKHAEIDLVISDVMMPGMAGAELMNEARKENPACKFLFCSGYAERIHEFLPKTESVPTLSKPFNPDQLRSAVSMLL